MRKPQAVSFVAPEGGLCRLVRKKTIKLIKVVHHGLFSHVRKKEEARKLTFSYKHIITLLLRATGYESLICSLSC